MSKELATATVVAALIKASAAKDVFIDTPSAIREIYTVFDSLGPAEIPIETDYLTCLLDGHRTTNLRKYVTNRGYTWGQYLEKFNLPLNYPPVAPAYSARRSAIAKENRLGVKNV